MVETRDAVPRFPLRRRTFGRSRPSAKKHSTGIMRATDGVERHATEPSLKLGKMEIRNLDVLSRSLVAIEDELKTEVDGILGADLLKAWDSVQLDYRGKVLILGSCNPCGP